MFSMAQKKHIFLNGRNTVGFALIEGKGGVEERYREEINRNEEGGEKEKNGSNREK